MPTISLGGPGVNALSHRWLEDLPVSLAFGERYFIQMDPDLVEPRASVWGMDNATTQIAVSVFIDRFLPRFLERCATFDGQLGPSEGDFGGDVEGDLEGESGADLEDEGDDD